MRIYLVFFVVCFSVPAMGQTFNFEPTVQSIGVSYEPPSEEVLAEWWWLNSTAETFDPGDGVERAVFSNDKNGNPVVHLRGKYFVYMGSLESPGTVTWKGREYAAYPASKPGKYILFVLGNNGMYAKYISPDPQQ